MEEEKGIQRIPVYFSDSFSDTDLEYNPWLEYKVPKSNRKESDKVTDESDKNPAVYLAQVSKEETEEPKLHLGES